MGKFYRETRIYIVLWPSKTVKSDRGGVVNNRLRTNGTLTIIAFRMEIVL